MACSTPRTAPALYCNGEHRWILSSNVDSPRLFDEEVDGLGFQLKEWPWHWGREQLLADLRQNRKVACDLPLADTHFVGDDVRPSAPRPDAITSRRASASWARSWPTRVEATCRNLNVGETEREMAGQLGHRLLHRGALPVHLGVAADGRSRVYRRYGFTATPVQEFAVLTATARKYGLTATASRSVSFGTPPTDLSQGHNAVCRVTASYLASTWPEAVPREILHAGRRIYLTQRLRARMAARAAGPPHRPAAVELPLTPQTEDLFQTGWAVTWSASAGARRQLRHLPRHRPGTAVRHAGRAMAPEAHQNPGHRIYSTRRAATMSSQ